MGSPRDVGAGADRSPLGLVMALLNGVGSLLILAITVLICADIVGRAVFGVPVAGVAELVSLSIVAVVFLQLGQAVRSHSLAQTGIVLDSLGRRAPRIAALLQCLYCVVAVLVFAALVYGVWFKLTDAWTSNEHVGVYGLFVAPIWPVYAVILVGSAAVVVQFGAQAWRYAGRFVSSDNNDRDPS